MSSLKSTVCKIRENIRTYEVGECATAMVPRGRVHYFVNESDAPMEMIWVYAGPMPERIVVDPRCATEDGNPWSNTT